MNTGVGCHFLHQGIFLTQGLWKRFQFKLRKSLSEKVTQEKLLEGSERTSYRRWGGVGGMQQRDRGIQGYWNIRVGGTCSQVGQSMEAAEEVRGVKSLCLEMVGDGYRVTV